MREREHAVTHTLCGQLIYLSGRFEIALALRLCTRRRTNERTDGWTDGHEPFQKWSWLRRLRYDRIRTYVRSAHIVRRPYVEKNAITPCRIWRQCTGACHRASTPQPPLASSLPPCLRPFVPRSNVRAECQLFLRLSVDTSLAFAISGHAELVLSVSRRPLRRSSFSSSHPR